MRVWRYIIPAVLLSISTASLATSDTVPLPFNDLPDFTIPKGQLIYQRYCLFCHGENGAGDGPNGLSLPQRPADLRKTILKRSNEQLFTVIQQGGAKKNLSSAMPAFQQTLSNQRTKHLIMYLRSLSKKK